MSTMKALSDGHPVPAFYALAFVISWGDVLGLVGSGLAPAGELPRAIFAAGFVAFYVAALPAYRVLMVWVYDRTGSLLVAMIMHAFLSASTLTHQPQTTAGYLTWNVVLAAALWLVVAAAAATDPGQLSRQPHQNRVA